MDLDTAQALSDPRERVAQLEAQVRRLTPRTTVYKPAGTSLSATSRVRPSVRLVSTPDRPITIGERTQVNNGTEIFGPVSIGSGCLINSWGYIRANTTIGDNVLVGPHTRFISDSHEIGSATKRAAANKWPPIIVGDGTWIGASVTIIGGVRIGRGCIIAAGAVVVSDVPDNTIVGGVPARPIRTLGEG